MKKIVFAISLSLCSLFSFAAENTSKVSDFNAKSSDAFGREVSTPCGVTYIITAYCDSCGYETLGALLASGVYYADALCYGTPKEFEVAP